MAEKLLLLPGGGQMRSYMFGVGGLYLGKFQCASTVSETKDDANIVTYTRTDTGDFKATFTGRYAQNIYVIGEPVLVNPDAGEDSVKIIEVSPGSKTADAYVTFTAFDDTTPADLDKEVHWAVFIQWGEKADW